MVEEYIKVMGYINGRVYDLKKKRDYFINIQDKSQNTVIQTEFVIKLQKCINEFDKHISNYCNIQTMINSYTQALCESDKAVKEYIKIMDYINDEIYNLKKKRDYFIDRQDEISKFPQEFVIELAIHINEFEKHIFNYYNMKRIINSYTQYLFKKVQI